MLSYKAGLYPIGKLEIAKSNPIGKEDEMKFLDVLLESVKAVWNDTKLIFIGFLTLVLVAVVTDRIMFVHNNVERVVDAQYGVVQWPRSSSEPLVKLLYTRNYDERGTRVATFIDRRWPLMSVTEWFVYTNEAPLLRVCKPGFLGRNCESLLALPNVARYIMYSGETKLAILAN